MSTDQQVQLTTVPPPAPVRATWVRYQVLAAGCLLAVLTYVQRLGLFRAVPAIKRDLRLDDQLVGSITAAFLIAYGGCQMLWGLLGDRFGARTLLTSLVLAWSALCGAVALLALLPAGSQETFLLILGLCFLFGLLQAGGFPNWARVVADWMPVQERGLAQGTLWTFSRLGGALAPALFLWLCLRTADGQEVAPFGWVPFFVVAAGLGVLWCGGFWPWFRNRPEEMARVNPAERQLIASGRPPAVKPGPVPWSRMLRSPSVWGLCLMYGFAGFSGNFITSLLAVYLKDHRKLTEAQTSWLTGLPLACGVVSCILGGSLSDWLIRRTGNRKWGRRIVSSVGLLFAGLATVAVPWAESVWLLGFLFSAWFFCNDLSMGPAWAACADVGERHAGTLSGAMNMMGSVVGAGGMKLAGNLFAEHRYPLLFTLFACSYGVAAACWLLVDVTRPLTAPARPSA
jgi:ACS family glucarate transporter-like MFS transporter